MPKNILLITSLYPCDDIKILNNTSVCHYFACEWKKMGYNVRVIFNYNIYPRIYYPFMKLFRKQMSNIFGVAIIDTYVNKHVQFEQDGILVDLIPMFKIKFGGRFSDKVIEKSKQTIIQVLKADRFKPDFIVGHFAHPNLELVVELKKTYNVKGTISLHGAETWYSEKDAKLFDQIDMMGYRSYPIKLAFENIYGEKPFFMCPSGIPEKCISQPHCFSGPVSQFIYVGTFMKRKYPSCLIPAISSAYQDDDYTITYIGDGDDKKHIIKKAKEHNCIDRIYFTGRISRDKIWQYLDTAEVFIMISKTETFGLVYLEAMARGCIVIASKNEGMDGIIENEVNGFLCEAGNEEELQKIVLRIKNMNPIQLTKISKESIKTAKKYTDYNVAKEYIKAIDIQ